MKEGVQTMGELFMSLLAIGISAMLVSWKHGQNAGRRDQGKLSGRSNTDDRVMKIQSKDTGMHDVHLGRPQSEEEYYLIVYFRNSKFYSLNHRFIFLLLFK